MNDPYIETSISPVLIDALDVQFTANKMNFHKTFPVFQLQKFCFCYTEENRWKKNNKWLSRKIHHTTYLTSLKIYLQVDLIRKTLIYNEFISDQCSQFIIPNKPGWCFLWV